MASFAMLRISSAHAQTELNIGESHSRMLSIAEMFRLADENNWSLRAASTAAEAAKERVKTAKNARLPSVDAALSLSYNGNGTITDRDFSHSLAAPIPHFGNNFSVEVSQVVFAGGAIRNGVKIAELQQQMAALNAEQKRQEVRFLIAERYLALCKSKNQLQVFKSSIAQTQQVLENMRARANEGAALQNDITRYELQLQSLSYAKIQLQNSTSLLNNQLTTAAGLPSSAIILPDTAAWATFAVAPAQYGGEERERERAWAWARARASPASTALAVQMAEKSEKMASHSEKISRAERLPQVALFAGDYLNSPVTIEIPALNKNFSYWAAGVGVKYNFGKLYKSASKIRANQLAVRQANEEKAAIEEQISLALAEALVHYNEAFVLLETREKSVELATQNYNVISRRYDNDLALITDLLDAASQKLDAELQAINARINIVYIYYKIKYISGRL
ncbi:MAG: TolC family protein [Prevotellaceae bacterium]|nr:TolC family protein [Prevotellaceae bacterium]